MIVYRFSKAKYSTDLSGKGAELYGGRWNSKGYAMLYTSQSRALAFTEIAMHIPFGIIPKDYFLISINIPDEVELSAISPAELPKDWRSNPPALTTQKIGNQFITDLKFLVLKVPSAIVPGDFNFLINPNHPEFSKVSIQSREPFEFDSRFFSRNL